MNADVSATNTKRRTTVVVGDLGACDVSARLLAGFAKFLADRQPDEVVAITRPSNYCHGDQPRQLSLLRSVEIIRHMGYAGTMLVQSNCLDTPNVESQCHHGRAEIEPRTKDLDVEEITGYHTIAPGWMTVCAATSEPWPYPAALAIRLARILGTSVTVGGTRALGILTELAESDSEAQGLVGSEIGTFKTLDRRSPREWDRGFLLLDVTKGQVHPTAVKVNRNDSFSVEGTSYF